MICPSCGHVNLPGNEECSNCLQDLTPLDRPVASNRVERSLMEDPVSVLRPKRPITIRPTTQLQSAIQAMLASDVGALLVTGDDGNLLGILSERDLLKKAVGVREPYGHLPASEFMTRNPETVGHGGASLLRCADTQVPGRALARCILTQPGRLGQGWREGNAPFVGE